MGQESPYPEVDQLIKENISNGGVQGYIRRCLYFKESNSGLFKRLIITITPTLRTTSCEHFEKYCVTSREG